MTSIERQGGIAMWRQIADEIRRAIAGGDFSGADMLPGEMALARRFGVNRHTVRSAIAALVQEGVLRAERGRGTFVEKRDRLRFPIRERTRFSEGLSDQTLTREGRLLKVAREQASAAAAAALEIEIGADLVRVDMLYIADRLPVSIASNVFSEDRFSKIGEETRRSGSITSALQALGIGDYTRKWTTVTARHADSGDLKALKLAPGAIVLQAEALNVDDRGTPIQYAVTRFAADRVELSVVR